MSVEAHESTSFAHTVPATVPATPPGKWRLLAPALLSWAATAWAITIPGAGGMLALCGAVIGASVLIGCVLARRSKQAATLRLAFSVIALACAALVLIGTRVSLFEHARSDPTIAGSAHEGRAIAFEATLVAYPEQRVSDFGVHSWARATIDGGRGTIPVLLWMPHSFEVPSHWAPGRALVARGVFDAQPPESLAAYTVRVLEVGEAVSQEPHTMLGSLASGLRKNLVAMAAAVPGAELVPGFAVGDTSLITDHLEAAMLESSLTHLVAVSGSNTGLVIAAVIWVCSWLGAGRRLRIALAAVALAGFVFVVGPDASVQRASVMAAVLLASNFGGRRATSLPALGAAVLTLLALDPWQALQPGFALSVAATGGILLFGTPMTKWLRRRLRLPAALALPLAIATVAQLACGPLLLLLQPGIPAVGVLANVLAAPAAPLGTGLGLIAALLGLVSSELGHAVVFTASLPARWIAATAEVTAAMPLARWSWPEGWHGALLLAGCELALMIAWALHRGMLVIPGIGRVAPRQPWQSKRQQPLGLRTLVAIITSASLGCIVAVTLVEPLGDRLRTPSGWAVVACDVGQGDAILLRDAARPGEVMLVDTGDDADLLNECLARFGVERISLLVLSHDDRDHVGALHAVIDRTDEALLAPTTRGVVTAQREVVRQLSAAGVAFTVGHAGMEGGVTPGGLTWRVLAPRATAAPKDSNAASLVMLAAAGNISVLLLGDTGAEQQQALLRSHEGLHARVLKVAHHGSPDQHHALPLAVAAEFALVSVGAENRYGHPATETLAATARAGTAVLRTDRHGSIALIPTAEGSIRPWVEHVHDARASQ